MPKMATMAAKMASFLFPTNMAVMAAIFCDGFAALSYEVADSSFRDPVFGSLGKIS